MPGADDDVRHAFAIGHLQRLPSARDGTLFLHVRPREAGIETTTSHFFNGEVTGHRKADFESLVNEPLTAYLRGPGLDIGYGEY